MSRARNAQPPVDFAAMARFPSYRAPQARDVRGTTFHPPQAPTLSTGEQRLLDAVIAEPDEDAPRRAYADWRGGDRGRFIHAQLDGQTIEPDRAWGEVFEPWCARDLVWRRGFVEGMSLAGRAFLTLGEPLFRMTPLRAVRLVAIAPYLDELLLCRHVQRLTVLDLRGNHLDSGLIAQLQSRHPATTIHA